MSDDLVKRVDSLMVLLNMERKKSLSLRKHIEKLESALREIIGALNDPKGGQHVYDMRNASYIARKALEKKYD